MKIKKILGTLFFLSLAVVLFSCSKKTFEVVFYDWDNTVLDTQKVEEGSVATAPKNPTREGYDFLGWNKEYTNITEDIEITATYQINTYTIVWKNHDGSVLATDSNIEWGSTPSYGGTTPTKAAPTEFNYTFIGWSPTVEVATSNQEYVAQFSETIKTYTVIWKNHDGSVLETDQVAYGEVPTYGGLTPIKEKTAQYTYTFSNWEPAISAVNGNQEYTAQFNSTVNSYEVTFKDWDGSELKKETVLYGAEATAPTEPTREGYEFDSWDVAFNNITGDLVVSATYQINTYTIVWKNHDGSVLATDSNIEWGSTPSYGGTTPTKAATAEFNYTFIGWSPTVEVATSNQEYVAQFSETIKTYTVIWKNHDGSVLETDQVAYGEVPTYGGLTPIKEKTAQYTYTFSNWEPAISAVNGNQEYTAQFNSTVNSYEVTFKDWDGSELKKETVLYGAEATAPTEPTREGYEFDSWDVAFNNITGDLVVFATYQINTYTIVWKNHDGSVLATDSNIEWGSTPSYGGTTPTKAATAEFNYTFIGWSPTVEVATSNQEYVAQFSETIKTYTVIWKNHDGSVLETDQVAYGEVPTYGGLTPIKEKTAQYTYTFSNWEPAISAVNGNQEYTAQFNSTVNSYEVTFKDWDGSELKKETVLYGAEATAPTEPTREGYEFDSWDVAFNNITGDLVVFATYQINTYTIVWKNHDGSVLATDSNIEWGSTPSYGGTTPTKAATAEFNYTFIGWSPTVEVATSNQEYVAQFSETIKTYTVIWKNHDGSVLETDQVAYGEVPTYGGLTPIKEKTAQYTYTFSNWEPAISAVNGNQEYTAQFNSTVNSYEVTFKDWDGSELKKETVLYGAEATAPTEPTREGYEFDSWDVAFNNITGDLVVFATYQINTYTIVWKNHDGSVLATDSNIEWGSTPSYGGTTPTKAATAEFNYTFIGWSPTVEVATSNQEYVAQFSETIKTYTVIWKNHDGSVLETDQVAYGEVPTYGGLTPIKEKTAQYTYTFSNWEPAISAVNGNQEYTAQFNSTVNSYEVTFKDWDGSELKKETVLYGAEATAPTEPTREGYEFDSWDVAFNNITGDLVVSATYTPIRVNQVVISVEEELDIFSGPFELTATVLPNEALNKTVSFSIVDSGLTGATITNNVLSVLNTGVLIIRAYADGIYSEDFTITIIDTTVYGVEITNTENLFRTNSAILLPNVETEIVLQLFPENAVPKNIQYILQNNTSGATVTDGKITATQSGSVRVYVVVDGVVSDNTFTFNVPIAITNADEFNAIRNNLNGFYMLTNHIDLSNYDWVPIGYAFYNNGALDYSNAFNGYLNGNGYDITGLNINMSNTDYITVGLFGVVGNSAIINDVNIVAGNLYGIANNNTEYVGLLSGLNLGKIRNGSISGTIKIQNGTYIGGVSGQVSSAEISNYDINVDIDVISTGNIYIGLSAGEFLNGTLTNNTVQGSIKLSTSGSAYVGGLVGKASNTVTFSNANVNILITKSGSAFVGGLLGYSDNIYRIENGIAIGNINVASNGSTYVGGIAGSSGNISDSSYDGDVSVTSNGSTYVGGIAGSSGNISDSSYDGDVSVTSNGSTYVGGIAGSSLSLYNVHNYGESISIYINAASSLNSYIGGISGKSSSVELAETNTNLSIVTSGNIFVGGISGESPIVNTNTSGLISVILKGTSGLSYVGGITGRGDVTQSASTSKIYVETLNGYIGGLSGSGNITDSSFAGSEVFVNTTSATGTNYIGGLTGSGNVINSDIDANILVSSKSNVYLGGLTGFGDVGNSLSNVNISFTSDKTSGSHYIGALSAISSSSVSNSSAFYTIEMLTKTGTYVGAIGSGNSISDINASGNINIIDAQVLNVGGVSGNATSINNSTFVGNINTSNSAQTYVGGLVGRISGDVLDSEANAEISVISTAVTPNLYGGIGGLIGFAERNSSIDAFVSNSQSYGSISANIKSLIPVGGLIGYISNQYYTGYTNRSYRLFQVENSYSKVNLIVNNTSTSSASTYVGGLIGQTTSNVLNSYAIGDVNATSSYEIRIGGLIGSLSTAVPITSSIKVTLPILNNSYSAYGLISSDTSPRGTITHIGGLVGYSEGDIKNSYTINYVNGSTSGSTKTLYVGGLVGSNKGVIDSSYTLSAFIYGVREELNDNDVTGIGQLSASVFVGGFVGNNMSGGIITNSYSRAITRIVTAFVGSFVGLNSGLISYSIGYGSITVGSAGENMVGGFAGSGTVGYYETYYSLPGTSISADKPVGTGLANGITGLTAVQLRSSSTFINFSNTYWQIINNLQPDLQMSSLSWEVYSISAVYSVRILKDINNKENQFDYPISDGMIEVTLNYNDSENTYSLFIKAGESYEPLTKYRDGYEFLGWFIDANLEIPYEGIITPETDNLYASWQKSYTSGLNYELINNLGWRVSIGSATDVEEIIIPNSHRGIPVLYIGSFANATSLTKIYIPDSVISINLGAFSGNTSLIEMRLPFIGSSSSSLTGSSGYLGYIFGASSYTSSSSFIPSSLVRLIVSNQFIIDHQTFYGIFHLEDVIFEETNPIFQSINGVVYTYNLSELVYYPPKKSTIEYSIHNTTTIRSTAFNNYSLSSVIIPNSVTSIGEGAFQGANNLTSITLPFVGGSRSTSTTVQSSSIVSQYLFGYIFGSNTWTSTANETNRVYQGQGLSNYNYRHYYIPSSLTSITITDASGISANSFYGMTNVTSITLNEGITFIGNNAFYGMTGLMSMEVPSSVTSIGTHAWYNNTSLASISLSDITAIPAYAFYGTTSLTTIDIPLTISQINEYAFYNSGLTSLTLPEITTSIGNYAFFGLSGITTLVIPENVQSIGNYAFSGANNVTSLTFNSNVLTTIGSYAFRNIKVTTLVIPNSVTSIGEDAFQGANNLTSITLPFVGGSRSTSTTVQSSSIVSQYLFGYIFGSYGSTSTANATNRVYQGQGSSSNYYYRHYSIPSSLTSITITDASGISANAFYGMTNVTSITLNEGITFIGNNAFRNIKVTTLVIPNSVTSIGEGAFQGANNLTSITLPFVGGSRSTSSTVQSSSIVSQYLFGYIFGSYTSTSTANATNQVYQGQGQGFDSNHYYRHYSIPSSLTSITITDASGISANAFYGMTNVTSITLNEGITFIGNNAFRNIKVTTLVIPNSVTSIGEGAFQGANNLTSITLPFVGGSRITSTTVQSSSIVSQYLFGYIFGSDTWTSTANATNRVYQGQGSSSNYYYRHYYIPSSLTSITITDASGISANAFYGMTNVTSITLNEGITFIGNNAFYGIEHLAP